MLCDTETSVDANGVLQLREERLLEVAGAAMEADIPGLLQLAREGEDDADVQEMVCTCVLNLARDDDNR
jgi:hypothetical protein